MVESTTNKFSVAAAFGRVCLYLVNGMTALGS